MAVKTVAVREGETCAVVMGHLRRRFASCVQVNRLRSMAIAAYLVL